MNITGIQSTDIKSFKGKRLDKNTVSQLIKNNPYSLTDNNQRYISKAIENLGKVAGEKNIQFLLEAAAKNKYSTNITLKDAPKNDWKTKLLAAASAAIAITPLADNSLTKKLESLKEAQPLTNDEQEILHLREQLLGVVDLEQINNETIGTIKNFSKNLDYFIISSETSIEHKKYVLERLNYFMSDEYEINPQLKDKKSIAVAEMVNDMAIHTPGNDIPNIKAINQKQHGMCAAISIVRKKLVYEDKPNYVDSIISELDSSNKMEVYDRNHLGSGAKINVFKVPVDFETALSKGYRIIDASTMHWMHIAGMSGQSNVAYNIYTPFDKENFDVKTDSFFHMPFEDEELAYAQKYYQSLIKAKSVIEDYKADRILQEINDMNSLQGESKKLEVLARINSELKTEISNINPNLSTKEVQNLTVGMLNLEKPTSAKIKAEDKFSYIPNEEAEVKKSKIKNYIINTSKTENISDESIDKLFFLINQHQGLTSDKVSKPSAIRKATQLYEIAAAFRYQTITGLEDKNNLHAAMFNKGVTNKEQLVLDTIDTLIEKLETNSPQSDLIVKQLYPSAFENTNGTKKEILDGLYKIKEVYTYNITEGLDSIYGVLTMGSRKEALYSYLDNIQKSIIEGDTSLLEPFSEVLGVKKSVKNVLRGLEKDKQKLLSDDEEVYNKLFNKYGGESQIDYVQNVFSNFINSLMQEDNQESIVKFLNVNGITMEAGEGAVTDRINLIASRIQQLGSAFNEAAKALKVVDQDGDILISANPKDVVIKKLENEGTINTAKQLRELQEHLIKIAKDRSSDEFQSRQGKLKDKSLNNFSNSEKVTLKAVEKSLNPMYALVQKQLKYVRTEMKGYLEELARIAGVNDGKYWVGEGSSGLTAENDIRILEYMTGRPHYSTQNYEEAIEIIKTSPYSGISSSSVYHDKDGGHAQYIADIAPVTLNNGEVKEVLFNDNTWGPSEKENTWVDSKGLTRTDYSDNRGGALGYITNEKYRNGNLVDRILSDMFVIKTPDTTESKLYKKIKNPSSIYEPYPQYYNLILDGKSKEIKNISDKIHDAIFVTNTRYVSKLKNMGKRHTEAELQAMITNIQNTGKSWKGTYEKLKERIFPAIGDGINSKEAYDKLADDDYLKVVLEKIALKENAQVTGLEPDIARVRNIKELTKFQAAQKARATNSFKYSFGKTMQIIKYLADSFGDKELDEQDAILDKFNIKLTDEEISKIGERFEVDSEQFDGSAKTTINLLMDTIQEDINSVVKDVDAQKALAKFYRDFFTEKMYFNEQDLEMNDIDSENFEHIVKFIDRVYDPQDNEEFVKIYRQIQDMTNDEFRSEVLSKATYEDMGIKSLTGYDILKRIQNYDEAMNTSLINTVYYNSVVTEIDDEKYEPSYAYERFTRRAKYIPNNNFNTIYRDLNYDLSLLTMPKLFNKYKDKNLKKYGIYPAYPEIEYLAGDTIKNSFTANVESTKTNINTIKTLKEQIQNYGIAHLLKKLQRAADKNMVMEGQNYALLNELFGRLIALNKDDSSVQEVFDSATEAIKLEEGTLWEKYLPHVNTIINRLTDFENSTSKETLEQLIKQKQEEITAVKRIFAEVFIQPQHKARMAELYNKYEQALIKQDSIAAEALEQELSEGYQKHHILNNPEELLGQYIRSCAEDARLKDFNEIFGQLLVRAIEFAKLAEIQDIIMEAVGDGVALNAKTKFNKHKLTFSDMDYQMGSNEMVTYMTNQLILDGQNDTGLLFLEKFGLSEQYVTHTAQSLDYEALETLIHEAHTLANNFADFQTEIEPYFEEAQKTFRDINCNYKKILKDLKDAINEKGAEYNIGKEYLKPLMEGIRTVEYNFKINPSAPKDVLFTTVMTTHKNNTVLAVQGEIEAKNNILASNSTILNFINEIYLPENSEAEKLRTEMNTHFNDLYNLTQELAGEDAVEDDIDDDFEE